MSHSLSLESHFEDKKRLTFLVVGGVQRYNSGKDHPFHRSQRRERRETRPAKPILAS